MSGFDVRDVVDMDVALHGRNFIVTEFALVGALAIAIAAVEVHINLLTALYAATFALNCATFMGLAAVRPRLQPPGLPSIYRATLFALVLLFTPLVFPAMALLQRRTQ